MRASEVQADCVDGGAHTCRYRMCMFMNRKLSTHDKMLFEAKPVTRLEEVRPYLTNADVIGIDEGQFFPDVCVCFHCIKWFSPSIHA